MLQFLLYSVHTVCFGAYFAPYLHFISDQLLEKTPCSPGLAYPCKSGFVTCASPDIDPTQHIPLRAVCS